MFSVTNTGPEAVTVTSLADDVYGNLNLLLVGMTLVAATRRYGGVAVAAGGNLGAGPGNWFGPAPAARPGGPPGGAGGAVVARPAPRRRRFGRH